MFAESGTSLHDFCSKLDLFCQENGHWHSLAQNSFSQSQTTAIDSFLSHPSFDFIFFATPPDSPGLVFCGGQLTHNRGSADLLSSHHTGTGTTVAAALFSSIGEAYEQIVCFGSQVVDSSDTNSSLGFGAGPTKSAAQKHGLLELIEHDALSNWWFGGKRAHLLQPDVRARQSLQELRQKVRKGQNSRTVIEIDLSTKYLIPTVALVSFDLNGECFALGSAARLTYGEAMESAFLEMCQIEFGHHIIRDKLKHNGWNGLSPLDRQEIAKASAINEGAFRQYISPDENPFRKHIPPRIRDLFGHAGSNHLKFTSSEFTRFSGPYYICKTSSRQLLSLHNTKHKNLSSSQSHANSPFKGFKGLLP